MDSVNSSMERKHQPYCGMFFMLVKYTCKAQNNVLKVH